MSLCGIDEAGRGPLAGPMTVVGVVLTNEIQGLDDSKKLTEKKRELLFDTIKDNSIYHIVITTNKDIDKFGLSKCIQKSIKKIMANIKASSYLMDGNTTFSIKNLECKIKADQTVQEVSAASILAKVTRDRYMKNIASSYPNYNFDKHKGYGTKAHIEAIKQYGFTDLHRTSYKIKGIN